MPRSAFSDQVGGFASHRPSQHETDGDTDEGAHARVSHRCLGLSPGARAKLAHTLGPYPLYFFCFVLRVAMVLSSRATACHLGIGEAAPIMLRPPEDSSRCSNPPRPPCHASWLSGLNVVHQRSRFPDLHGRPLLRILAQEALVGVHSKCLTGDVFHSGRCDCGAQLEKALARIGHDGRGVLLYLNQEGRGIGLANKIRAYELQDQGLDTVEANEKLGFKADQRDYGIGAQILNDLGVKTMRLLTNNPRKFVGLQGYGLAISDAVPLEIPASDTTRRYLKTKKDKLGHRLSSV